MRTYRATSYALGRPLASVVFEAAGSQAAVRHPSIRTLPVGGQTQGGRKGRIVGVKLVR